MNRYEYKVLVASGEYSEVRADADALGEEGWELINVFPLPPRYEKREMWFKRLKQISVLPSMVGPSFVR